MKISKKAADHLRPEWDQMQETIKRPFPLSLNSVLVKFEDPTNNYHTSVSCHTTNKTARDYFIGQNFLIEPYPSEKTAKCIDIEFTNNNK